MINAIETPMPSNFESPDSLLIRYDAWLRSQSFSKHTKRNYLSQLKQFLVFAKARNVDYRFGLSEPSRRTLLVENYRSYLREESKARVSTINKSLAAIDHLCRFLGYGPSGIKREKLLCQPPKILTAEETSRLLQALEAQGSTKDKAVVALFLYTGIRLGECAALNVSDLVISADSAELLIRNERISDLRSVPLEEPIRGALLAWLFHRNRRFPNLREEALFINSQRKRFSTSGLDLIVRKVGIRARLVLSAQLLRDTFLTELAKKHNDAFLIAKISGCKRLDSARKYFDLAASTSFAS